MTRDESVMAERRAMPLLARRVPLWMLVLVFNVSLILVVTVAALARSAEKHGALGVG